MRARTRRRVIGSGALALSGALLAACGGGAPSGQGTGGDGGAQRGTTAPADTAGTLNVWHYFSTSGQKTILTEWAAMFNRKYPKVNVQYVFVEFSELSKKVIAAAGARSGPDVMIYGGSDLSQMQKTGAFKSMQPYWDKFADKSMFPDGVISKFNNQVYGVKGYVNLVGLWFNKDILDAVGVEPPKTIDEVTPALAKVAGAGKGYTAIALTGQPSNQGDWTAWPWLSGYGYSYDSPAEAAVEPAMALANTWASRGFLPKDAVSWGQSETFDRFSAGDVAFMQNGNWNIGPAKEKLKFKFGVVPMPIGPRGGTVFLGGEAGWLGNFATNPELAWAYLEQTYTKEGNIIPLRGAGSIPARADLAASPEVTNEPLLVPFASTVKTRGQEYPPKGGDQVAAQLVVAQNWSASIAGQKTPQQAAKDTVEGVKTAK